MDVVPAASCDDSYCDDVDAKLVKDGRTGSPFCRPIADLDRLQIHGLRAFGIRLDVKGHALAFRQGAHAGRFNCCRMDEHVLAAAFRRDEAKAFVRIEELHCSDRH